MNELLFYPVLAGVGVAIVAGPLGAFVVWRRMSYFGETLSHSALLGVALGLLIDVPLNLAVVLCSVLMAVILACLQRNDRIASDTVLGILAHSALSLGLVAVSLQGAVRVDMMSYLFGDMLAAGPVDLVWIYGGGATVLLLLWRLWRPLLAMTVHEELARAEGVPVDRIRFLLILMTALVIAVAMKIVGVLLVTSLLVIPAATARRYAHTPEQMAVGASGLGIAAVFGGMGASWSWDTPTGPSVVMCSTLLFVCVHLLPHRHYTPPSPESSGQQAARK